MTGLLAAAGRLLGARPGEERAVAVAFAYFCLLLCSYYTLRPLRDAMAAAAGADNIKWLFTGTFVVMLLIAPLYGWLVSRIPRRRLLPSLYLFFVANLLVFVAVFRAQPDSMLSAVAFFIWLAVFNMFIVSVFWSFMADIFRGERSRRLFGPIAAGGSTGAILGPLLAQGVVGSIGPSGLVLVSAILLSSTIGCIVWLLRWREAECASEPVAREAEKIGGGALAGIRLLATSPYLLGVATIVFVGSQIGTFMYIELARLALEAYPDDAARTAFYARIDLAVSLTALLLQGFVTSRVASRVGVGPTIAGFAGIACLTLLWLVGSPLLFPLAVTQVVRRAGEYGVAKPCREMLFGVVDAETKYKAKNFIDTAVQRASDMSSGWLHGWMAAGGMTLAGFAAIGAGAMIGLMLVGIGLGRAYRRLDEARDSTAVAGVRAAH